MIDAKLSALFDQGHPGNSNADHALETTAELDPDPAPGFKPDGTLYTDEEVTAIWAALEEAAARLPALEAEALHLPE